MGFRDWARDKAWHLRHGKSAEELQEESDVNLMMADALRRARGGAHKRGSSSYGMGVGSYGGVSATSSSLGNLVFTSTGVSDEDLPRSGWRRQFLMEFRDATTDDERNKVIRKFTYKNSGPGISRERAFADVLDTLMRWKLVYDSSEDSDLVERAHRISDIESTGSYID